MSLPTPHTCAICLGEDIAEVRASLGRLFYCRTCFHGWRALPADYDYGGTAMCPFGTDPLRLQRQIDFFAPFTPAQPRVLEIGCATGELAAATRQRLNPCRYEAIELSPAGAQARERVDRLHDRPLASLLASGDIDGPFDLILMSHVLEHIPDPAAEIGCMTRLLAPAGAIFLETPNRSGNRSLPIDDNASHRHFFSIASLSRLLAAHGLETLAAATDVRLDARYSDSLQVVARPFAPPAWSRTLLSDHPALAGEDRVVVWGAGSLAHELLANYFAPERIDFFIDRNPQKWGSTLLGRPVRGPDALGNVPRTILINSIDFAASIAEDIGSMRPPIAHRLIRIGDLLG